MIVQPRVIRAFKYPRLDSPSGRDLKFCRDGGQKNTGHGVQVPSGKKCVRKMERDESNNVRINHDTMCAHRGASCHCLSHFLRQRRRKSILLKNSGHGHLDRGIVCVALILFSAFANASSTSIQSRIKLRSLAASDFDPLSTFLRNHQPNPLSLKYLHEIHDVGPLILEKRSWYSDSEDWKGEHIRW
jgi:hypothetical protein